METLMLKAQKREMSTKGFLNTLRKEGNIPAICYGKDNVNISVNGRDFGKLFPQAKQHIVFDLDIENDKKRKVLVKHYQIDPVVKNITHIDFLEISKDKKVTAQIPIILTGQAVGSKVGGVLEHKLHKLTIKTSPDLIPKEVEIDVTPLDVGDAIYVESLKLDEKIKILAKPRQAIVAVSASRTTKLADEEASKEAAKETKEESK